MIDVIEVKIRPSQTRIGMVLISYYDIRFWAEICLYKRSHLWIRMPEKWLGEGIKVRDFWWKDQETTDKYKVIILAKIYELVALDLDRAIKEIDTFFANKKQLTEVKNKLTLSKNTSEEKSSE